MAVQPDTGKESEVSELQDELVTREKSIEIKHAHLFQNLLLGVSIILILGTAIFALDLILSVVLGCLVSGFNFVWYSSIYLSNLYNSSSLCSNINSYC